MHQSIKRAERKQLSITLYQDDILEENLIIEDQSIYADTRGWHAFEGYYDSSNADEWYLTLNKDIIFNYIADNNMFKGNYISHYIIADTAYFIVPLTSINVNCDDFNSFKNIDFKSLSSVFHVSISFTSKYWYDRQIDSVDVALILKERYNEYAYKPLFYLDYIDQDRDYPEFIKSLDHKLVWIYVQSNLFQVKSLDVDSKEFVEHYKFYLEVGEIIDY